MYEDGNKIFALEVDNPDLRDSDGEGCRRKGKLRMKVKGEAQMIPKCLKGFKDSSDEEQANVEKLGDEMYHPPPLVRLDRYFGGVQRDRRHAMEDSQLELKILELFRKCPLLKADEVADMIS
jgi:hypothetical protein